MNFEKELDSIDFPLKSFKFVNFRDKYIKDLLSLCSHYQINHSMPSLTKYNNVIYTPYLKVEDDKRYGCLYDEQGKRIEDSCLKRKKNKCLTKDSIDYTGTANLEFFDGKAIYLGIIFAHYGHFLLESISRWWPLVEPTDNFDYYLFHLASSRILERTWVDKFLSLAGIDKRRIIYFDKPTKIKSVIVPETSLQIDSHVFYKYRDICKYFTRSLDLKNIKETEQPLYFSRRLLNEGVRKISGEKLLEDLLLKNGFCIIHPQFFPIEEQIYLINRHKYIMGIIGSALHNLVFSLSDKKIIYIASENNLDLNYIMLDRLFKNQSTYINSYRSLNKNEEIRSKISRLYDSVFGNKKEDFKQEFILDYEVIYQWLREIGYVK